MVESTMNGNDSDSGDEAAFLQSLGLKQNLRKGKEVAAKAASSSKGKDKSATTGGGSFQSMGVSTFLVSAMISSEIVFADAPLLHLFLQNC